MQSLVSPVLHCLKIQRSPSLLYMRWSGVQTVWPGLTLAGSFSDSRPSTHSGGALLVGMTRRCGSIGCAAAGLSERPHSPTASPTLAAHVFLRTVGAMSLY